MQPRAADRKSPGQWNECTKQIKGERLAAIVRSSHSSRLAFLYIYTSYSYIITYYLRVICNCPGWRCSLLRHSSHLYNRSSIDRYQKHEQQIRFFFFRNSRTAALCNSTLVVGGNFRLSSTLSLHIHASLHHAMQYNIFHANIRHNEQWRASIDAIILIFSPFHSLIYSGRGIFFLPLLQEYAAFGSSGANIMKWLLYNSLQSN